MIQDPSHLPVLVSPSSYRPYDSFLNYSTRNGFLYTGDARAFFSWKSLRSFLGFVGVHQLASWTGSFPTHFLCSFSSWGAVNKALPKTNVLSGCEMCS